MKIAHRIYRYAFILVSISGSPNILNAQDSDGIHTYPKVGALCPEFSLKNVFNGPMEQMTLKDMKDQWTVLYFWSRWCTTSMTDLEKIQGLHEKFKDEVSFVVVGKEDSVSRTIFKKLKNRYGLTLPYAFEEYVIQSFGIISYPHIITVAPDGMVKTISLNISEEGMSQLIGGVNPNWLYSKNEAEKQLAKKVFNREKPFLMEGNGGEEADMLFRSVLLPWHAGMPITGVHVFRSGFRANEVLISGVDLSRLYQLAYGSTKVIVPASNDNDYGNWWYRPILNVKDSTAFGLGLGSSPKLFTYSLIVPKEKGRVDAMRNHMRSDLENYFGYQISIETRMMPYWKLLVTEKAKKKLKTKGGAPKITGDGIISTQFINQPMSSLIKLLWGYNQNGPPFIDCTNMETAIDLSLKGQILIDFEGLRDALKEQGFSLQKEKKPMKVIIINDKL